jgi:hypothetical protein
VPANALRFTPAFWCNLFCDVECRINPELLELDTMLATFSALARKYGVDPHQRLLPFMFLTALASGNIGGVLRHPEFQRYLFGAEQDPALMASLMEDIGSIQIDHHVDELYEDAWVLMLSTSFFRKVRPSEHFFR